MNLSTLTIAPVSVGRCSTLLAGPLLSCGHQGSCSRLFSHCFSPFGSCSWVAELSSCGVCFSTVVFPTMKPLALSRLRRLAFGLLTFSDFVACRSLPTVGSHCWVVKIGLVSPLLVYAPMMVTGVDFPSVLPFCSFSSPTYP